MEKRELQMYELVGEGRRHLSESLLEKFEQDEDDDEDEEDAGDWRSARDVLADDGFEEGVSYFRVPAAPPGDKPPPATKPPMPPKTAFHRRVLRGNIQAFDHACFARVLAKAGIHSYPEDGGLLAFQRATKEKIETYVRDAVTFAEFKRARTVDSFSTLAAIDAISEPIFGFGLMRDCLIGKSTGGPPAGFLTTFKEWAGAAKFEREQKAVNDEDEDGKKEGKDKDDDEEEEDEDDDEEEYGAEDPHGEATKELISNEQINDSGPCLSYARFQRYIREVGQDYKTDLFFEPQAFKMFYMAWERDMITAEREIFKIDCVKMISEELQKRKDEKGMVALASP